MVLHKLDFFGVHLEHTADERREQGDDEDGDEYDGSAVSGGVRNPGVRGRAIGGDVDARRSVSGNQVTPRFLFHHIYLSHHRRTFSAQFVFGIPRVESYVGF